MLLRAMRPDSGRPSDHYPEVEVRSLAALRAWFARHQATAKGAWIVTTKRTAGGTVTWNDVVEEALCVGWIDSVPRKVDEARTSVLVTPRKPRSKWSAKNKAHVADLERRSLMRPAGAAAVELARRTGTWNALDAVSALVVPADLAKALSAHAPAPANWNAFPPRHGAPFSSGSRAPDARRRGLEAEGIGPLPRAARSANAG